MAKNFVSGSSVGFSVEFMAIFDTKNCAVCSASLPAKNIGNQTGPIKVNRVY